MTRIMKFFKSLTNHFGLLVILLPEIQAALPEFQDVLGDHYNLVFRLIGLAIIALRYRTKVPMADK